MKKTSIAVAALGVLASVAFISNAQARDQIRIVGSSTVYPFATAVAEQFGKTTEFKTPVIESTGSGGGMKLFCAGVGTQHPDVTNASRRMKKSEFELCNKNGVTDITEVVAGFDGIVIANSKASPKVSFTRKQIFLALAKEIPGKDGKLIANPHKKWSDIDASLPDTRIEVLGPPPTSGTRDAFSELALEAGAKKFPTLKAMRKENKKAFKKVAHAIREDGAYIEAGENDVLIIQKLVANKNAFGVFGFSFLDQNADKVQGAIVENVEPQFEKIAGGDYPISRSLFFYVKKAHVGTVPGIKEYVAEFVSENAFGDEGYLVDKGLIPLPAEKRDAMRKQANGLANLSM